MRVAVLVTHWKNTQGTGVTRYVINLTEELRHYPDVDVRVIYRYGKDSTNRRIRGTKFTFPLKALPVLFKYAPDVVYVDMPPGTVIMAGSDVTFDTRSSSAGGGRGPGHEIFGCHGRQ